MCQQSSIESEVWNKGTGIRHSTVDVLLNETPQMWNVPNYFDNLKEIFSSSKTNKKEKPCIKARLCNAFQHIHNIPIKLHHLIRWNVMSQ